MSSQDLVNRIREIDAEGQQDKAIEIALKHKLFDLSIDLYKENWQYSDAVDLAVKSGYSNEQIVEIYEEQIEKEEDYDYTADALEAAVDAMYYATGDKKKELLEKCFFLADYESKDDVMEKVLDYALELDVLDEYYGHIFENGYGNVNTIAQKLKEKGKSDEQVAEFYAQGINFAKGTGWYQDAMTYSFDCLEYIPEANRPEIVKDAIWLYFTREDSEERIDRYDADSLIEKAEEYGLHDELTTLYIEKSDFISAMSVAEEHDLNDKINEIYRLTE